MSAEDASAIEAQLEKLEQEIPGVKALQQEIPAVVTAPPGAATVNGTLMKTQAKAGSVQTLMKTQAKAGSVPKLMKTQAKAGSVQTLMKTQAKAKAKTVKKWKGAQQAGWGEFQACIEAVAAAVWKPKQQQKQQWQVSRPRFGQWQKSQFQKRKNQQSPDAVVAYDFRPIKRSDKVDELRLDHIVSSAAWAEAHFAGKQVVKRQKLSADSRTFVQEILDKAPDNLQTCRSLQQFLEKKLEAKEQEAPDVGGPEALKGKLEAYANTVGRLSGLQSSSGWDARAKRALDILAATKREEGVKALKVAEENLQKSKPELEELLKASVDDNGGKNPLLEACVEKRVAWAKDAMKREWLAWCTRVLQVRDAALANAGLDIKKGGAISTALSFPDIIEALLVGESNAGKVAAVGPEKVLTLVERRRLARLEEKAAAAESKADAKAEEKDKAAAAESKADAKAEGKDKAAAAESKADAKVEGKDEPKAEENTKQSANAKASPKVESKAKRKKA